MRFALTFTDEARAQLVSLQKDRGLEKRLKAVRKTLGLLESNPRHPGLQSHKYQSRHAPDGGDLFEVYAESATPAAYRVFWFYGPGRSAITIVAITPHP